MQPSRSVPEKKKKKKKKKGRKPSFFKFFFPGITDKQLEIPKAFLKHLEGESYGPAFLRCPSGKMSCVNLVEKNDGVFLHKCGWRSFVENHSLQVGYCLVFKYYGKLQFSIRIFDTNACEAHVESCCCSSDDCGSKGEEDTEGTKGKTSPDYGNVCGHRANGHSAQESSFEVDELDTRNFQETSSHVKFCKHANHKVENKWEKIRYGRSRPLISQRRPVTVEETERAYNAAKSFSSKHPFVLVIMRKHMVYQRFFMPFPQAFVNSSLPKDSSPMTLYDPSGKNWETRYIYRQRSGGISGGWIFFSFGNNLEVNDVCVFELIEQNKMQVHIFRVVDEIAPLLKPTKRTRTRCSMMSDLLHKRPIMKSLECSH